MTDHQPERPNKETLSYCIEESSISLADILLFIARHIKVILITPTILCTLTIFYVLFIADTVYTSTSKIMSSSSSKSVSPTVGLAAQLGITFPTGHMEPQWAYPEIIKSRTLARLILNRKYDTKEFGPQKTLLQILTFGNDERGFGMDILEIKAIDKFLEMIDVSENIKTGIFTLNLDALESRLAADINKALIEELDIHLQEYNRAKTSDTRKFIEERIVDTEKELMSTEEALKIFLDRNRRIENSPGLQLEQQRLSREVAVLTGVFTTLKQQLETTKIEEVKESDYVIILDAPEVPLKRSKPRRKLIIIVAGILGIGLGLFIAFVREYIINSDKEEKEKMIKSKSLLLNKLSTLIPSRLKRIN